MCKGVDNLLMSTLYNKSLLEVLKLVQSGSGCDRIRPLTAQSPNNRLINNEAVKTRAAEEKRSELNKDRRERHVIKTGETRDITSCTL